MRAVEGELRLEDRARSPAHPIRRPAHGRDVPSAVLGVDRVRHELGIVVGRGDRRHFQRDAGAGKACLDRRGGRHFQVLVAIGHLQRDAIREAGLLQQRLRLFRVALGVRRGIEVELVVAEHADAEDTVGGFRHRRTAPLLHDGGLVDGILQRLAHAQVLQRALVVVRDRVDEQEVRIAGGHGRQLLVAGGGKRREDRGRHVDVIGEIAVARLKLLHDRIRLHAHGDVDLVDIGLAQRIALSLPGRVAHQFQAVIGRIFANRIGAASDEVGAVFRAVGKVVQRLDGRWRGHRQGEHIDEVAGPFLEFEHDGLVVGRLDARDVVAFHIGLHRRRRRLDLGKTIAEFRQAGDQGREIGERRRLHMRIAEALETTLHVDRRDLARAGRRIPHRAVAQGEGVGQAVGARLRNLDCEIPDRLDRNVRIGGRLVADELAGDRAHEIVRRHHAGKRRVHMVGLARRQNTQHTPGLRLLLRQHSASLQRADHGRRRHQNRPVLVHPHGGSSLELYPHCAELLLKN